MDEPSVDPDEVEARLYLIGPNTTETDSIIERLSAVLDHVHPAAFLLPLVLHRDGTVARQLRDLCQDRGIAFFVQDDVKLAKDLAADGIHQSDNGSLGRVREALEKDQILGVDVGHSRHDAIVVGEEGADFVAFGQLGQVVDQEVLDLITWWRDLFVLPSLAYADTPDEARMLADAGADFIAVCSAIWNDPDGPATGARRLQAAIEKN